MSTNPLTFDQSFWENRYSNNQTGWDTGEITSPLKAYFDQLADKDIKILIPGAGNAYEAEYLHENGFTNVFVLDIASQPLENIKQRNPSFPSEHLVQQNFFDHKGSYHLIIEQTFFCALHPDERNGYSAKMAELLVPGGKLAGLLFNTHFEGGPPFGGCADDYISNFEPWFHFMIFEPCFNSIKPRAGKELFMILEKK